MAEGPSGAILMSVLTPIIVFALAASAAERPDYGAAEAASRRLEERAQTALDALLGERMAVVTVEAQGERVVMREQSEVATEVRQAGSKTAVAEMMEVPGYGKAKVTVKPPPDYPVVHRLAEEKTIEAGFQIRFLRATLVVDPSAGESAVTRAVEVCGQVLGLDPLRGDELEVVRAVLQPRWKRALSRTVERRAVWLVAALAFAALLLKVLSAGFARVARALRLIPAPTGTRRVAELPRLGAPPAESLARDDDGGGA